MTRSDRRGCLVCSNGHAWRKPGHRPAHQHVLKVLGPLASHCVDNLSAERSGLRIERLKEVGSTRGVSQNVPSAGAVQGNETMSLAFGEAAISDELLAEGLQRNPGRAWQRRTSGGARSADAEPRADQINHLFGKAAMGCKLTADDRKQPAKVGRMIMDDVPASNCSLFPFRLVWERADTAVGVQDSVRAKVRAGNQRVCLIDEICDLLIVRLDLVRRLAVPDVCRANKVVAVPWNHKDCAPIGPGLEVESILGSAGKRRDHDMAALRAPNQADGRLAKCGCQYLVNPRTGRINDKSPMNGDPAVCQQIARLNPSDD